MNSPTTVKCQIFSKESYNAQVTNKGIITLEPYYPKSKIELHNMFSSRILIVKEHGKKETKKSWEVIDYFTKRIQDLLRNDIYFVVCVVPSHDIGCQPTGIRTIAESLCSHPIIDGTKAIERIKRMSEKHLGGNRNLTDEKQSLRITQPGIIDGRPIFLLDDVTTTGISLHAAKDLLLEKGALYVAPFALGKTYLID